MDLGTPILKVLDRARWAPSGDNVQPWRFRILSDLSADMILTNADDSVFDIDKIASLTSFGCLIETAHVAAIADGYDATFVDKPPPADIAGAIRSVRITLTPPDGPHETAPYDPVAISPVIEQRSVGRGRYGPRPLNPQDRTSLMAILPAGYELRLIEGENKRTCWPLFWINNKILMSWWPLFPHYKKTILWAENLPTYHIPGRSLGMDLLTQWLFRLTLKNWTLFRFVHHYMGGMVMSFFQLAILPSVFSAAHIALIARTAPKTDDDYIAAGRVIQRFWLTATTRGILHQPNFMPIAMSRHAKYGIPGFPKIEKLARAQRHALGKILGGNDIVDRVVWMGRIGYGKNGPARSLRLPLDQLLIP